MSETPHIRSGHPTDAPKIATEYWRAEATPKHVTNVENALRGLPSAIAEQDGETIGFAYCSAFAPDILEIDNLFVNEQHRNKSIGSLLLRHIELTASERFDGIILVNSDLYGSTVVDKKSPSNFYLRHGFNLALQTQRSRVFTKDL